MATAEDELNAFLDAMEEPEDETPVEKHDWQSERAVMFGCDDQKFRCSKCAVRLTVRVDQSIKDAVEEQEVNPNCAEQLVNDMQDF